MLLGVENFPICTYFYVLVTATYYHSSICYMYYYNYLLGPVR